MIICSLRYLWLIKSRLNIVNILLNFWMMRADEEKLSHSIQCRPLQRSHLTTFYFFAFNRSRRQKLHSKLEAGASAKSLSDPEGPVGGFFVSTAVHEEVTCWPRLDWQCRGQCGLVSGGDRRWAAKNYGLRPGLPGPRGRTPRRGAEAALHQSR